MNVLVNPGARVGAVVGRGGFALMISVPGALPGFTGTFTLALEDMQGQQVTAQTSKFKISPLGQETLYSDFKFPAITGDFLLRAIIQYPKNGKDVSTQSRRRVKLVKADQKQITK